MPLSPAAALKVRLRAVAPMMGAKVAPPSVLRSHWTVGVGWPVHMMHTAGLLMAVIFMWIFFVPWAAMRRALAAGDQASAGAALGRIRHLITVNLVIGLLTVALGTLK